MIPIAINSVSAGSKTQPGGYADDVPLELEQFEPHDGRTPQQVAQVISDAELQPVWKDWDGYLERSTQYAVSCEVFITVEISLGGMRKAHKRH